MGNIPASASLTVEMYDVSETERVAQDSDNKMVKICDTLTVMVLLLLP